MILLGMMGLVENKQIDLIHSHIRIDQALVQYLCCAHYHHVRFEVLIPGLFAPQICSHGTEELRDILVEIVAQDSPLLVYEGDAIYLDGSQLPLFFCGIILSIPERMIYDAAFPLRDHSIHSE